MYKYPICTFKSRGPSLCSCDMDPSLHTFVEIGMKTKLPYLTFVKFGTKIGTMRKHSFKFLT